MSNQIHNRLPTQTEFLEHGLIACTPKFPCPAEVQCTICTDNCDNSHEEILQLVTCTHYFHKECIQAWFSSSHRMRGTCPNCRANLFIPDNLAEEEIQEQGSRVPSGVLRNQIAQMMIEQASETLERFVAHQDELLETDEIIDGWTASEGDRLMLEDWIPTFRRSVVAQNNCAELAQHIETALRQAKDKYKLAARAQLLAEFLSIDGRLSIIRANLDYQEPSELSQIETKVRKMLKGLSESTSRKLAGLINATKTISARVHILARKFNTVEPYQAPDRPSLQHGNPGSNFSNLDESDLELVNEIIRNIR